VIPRGVLAPAALAAGLLAASVGLARAADDARSPEARVSGGAPPLGVLNVLAVDLLWLRADGLYAEHRWPEMAAAYEMAGRIEPRLAAAFEFRGFHLAYNLASSAASEADRDRWVLAGIDVFSQGLSRNPSSASLRSWLGHALFARSERWPSLTEKLRAKRGRDPWDEAADLLGSVAAESPDDGRAVIWLADVLEARGRRTLAAAPADAPCPDAAADFGRAAEALRALAPHVPADGRATLASLAADLDRLRAAAETSDPAERKMRLAE
jgi:hypothetical protein